MTGNHMDLTNRTFGRLTPIKRIGTDVGGGAIWLCDCDCGGRTTARASELKSGLKRSCGCLRRKGSVNTASITGTTIALFEGYVARGMSVEKMSRDCGRSIEQCAEIAKMIKPRKPENYGKGAPYTGRCKVKFYF